MCAGLPDRGNYPWISPQKLAHKASVIRDGHELCTKKNQGTFSLDFTFLKRAVHSRLGKSFALRGQNARHFFNLVEKYYNIERDPANGAPKGIDQPWQSRV